MTPEEIRQIVWNCLRKPLERRNLPWAREELHSLPIKNPVMILLDYTDNVVINVDTDILSNDSTITWNTLDDIHKALTKQFGTVKCSQLKNFKFFEFKVL